MHYWITAKSGISQNEGSQPKELFLNISVNVTRKISSKLLAMPPYTRESERYVKMKTEWLCPTMSWGINGTSILIEAFLVKILLINKMRPEREAPNDSAKRNDHNASCLPALHLLEGNSATWCHRSSLKSQHSTLRIAFGAWPPTTTINWKGRNVSR